MPIDRQSLEIFHREPDEHKREKFHDSLLSHIEDSLNDAECFVGRGSIAKVVSLKIPEGHKMLCAKFTDTDRKFGTINYSEKLNVSPFHNDVKAEAGFLDDLQMVDSAVSVPEPYYFFEKKFTGAEPEGQERIKSFLVMEQLNAVSFDDVFEGRSELPETFSPDDFFRQLDDFIAAMHSRKVYHRDLHEGNVMIDIPSGRPRVVDFGSAAHATEYDAYEEWRPGKVENRFLRDENCTSRLRRLVTRYLTKNR